MNLTDMESSFPALEWHKKDPSKEYPIQCRVGEAVTTVQEMPSQMGWFVVSWSDGKREFLVKVPNLPLAKWTAEIRARLLYLQLQKGRARLRKGANA